MNSEQRLNQVADSYRSRGFKVVVHPEPDQLPPFAKDFKVEIVATKEDGSALVVVKSTPSELEADPNVQRYADITSGQADWRLDLVVLGPDTPRMPIKHETKDLEEREIRRLLDDIERMVQAGFVAASLAAAWAALEASMRRRLRASGAREGCETDPRTMLNELFSAGVFSNRVFRDLEGLFQLRNIVVHGFAVPEFPPSSVEFLLDTARQLLEPPPQAKQTA
jgi:hypothetical protein